jgi:hypothetical protein
MQATLMISALNTWWREAHVPGTRSCYRTSKKINSISDLTKVFLISHCGYLVIWLLYQLDQRLKLRSVLRYQEGLMLVVDREG